MDARADVRMKDAALAAAKNGIVIVDALAADLPIVYVNAGFERLTGYPREEAIGRNCRFLQGPDTDRRATAALATAVREERSATVVVRNHRRDGTPL